MMHGDPKDMNVVDAIVDSALASKDLQSFSLEEKESMSLFYLKVINSCDCLICFLKEVISHE